MAPGGEPQTYKMAYSTAGGGRGQGTVPSRYFAFTVIILEEEDLFHPRCPPCNMLVTWKAKNRRHITTAHCAKGEERKRWQLEEEWTQESA